MTLGLCALTPSLAATGWTAFEALTDPHASPIVWIPWATFGFRATINCGLVALTALVAWAAIASRQQTLRR